MRTSLNSPVGILVFRAERPSSVQCLYSNQYEVGRDAGTLDFARDPL